MKFLPISLVAIAAAGLFAALPALAQTSVTNTATVAPPADVADPTPGNDSDDAIVTVTAPLPDFGSCDASMYMSQGNGGPITLYQFDTSTNPFVYTPLGSDPVQYNSTAFNPDDNYLYATRNGTNNLVRVGSNGAVEDLGPVAGLPGGGVNYNAGEIAPDGSYYVKQGGANNQLYRIDIATMTATAITLSQSVGVADLAWHNGLLYGVGTALTSIDPNTGAVTLIGATGGPSAFGAMFGASNGVYGGSNNGGFYQFDLVTGAATLISDSPGAAQNDGAKCPTTPLEFPADLSIDKDDGSDTYVPGEDVTYTIVVSNLGPFGAAGATVSDPLPAGIGTASWTCGNATGGGSCGVASGSGAIVDIPVNLPAGGSVTFSLTLSVPAGFSGDLVNTATVTAPDGSPDPDSTNNSDTDTDTIEPAVVTVEKTANPAAGQLLTVGQTITYTLTTTVAGGPTSDVVTLADSLGAGLSFGAVTDAGSFSCSGALQCTLPAGTPAGTYALSYTATVDAGAGTTVSNAVTPSGGDGPTCGTCAVQHQVQPNFGSCDATMYLAQNQPTGLFQFDTAANPFIVNPVGPTSAVTYNAIAVNPIDSYIYGLRGPAPGTLVRVGSDGSVVDVGTITNFPINSVIGEFGPDGTYYTGNGSTLYRVDLATMTATAVPLSQTINGQDLAWHNGQLYIAAPDAGQLYAIDPANGNVTPIGSTTVAGAFGGMFGAINGVFGSNNNGGFYRFDLGTGQATLISDLPGSGSNDGAKCATTPLEFPADLSIDKDDGRDTYVPGEDVTYTIVVSNLGPFGVAGATVDDPLPAGIATASWTCGNATGGGSCGTASGSGAIAGVPVNLPAGASVTFSLTLSVPVDFSGDLVNTATVTAPAGSPDPDTSNNTDDDTDTREFPVIATAKTANPAAGTEVQAGQTITYTLTVTVTEAPTSEAFVLTDTLDAGLSFGAVTNAGAFSCTGTLQCTLPTDTPAGSYAVTYTATVDADASGTIGNSVTGTGGGDVDPECVPCRIEHEVAPPAIAVAKTAVPASGAEVQPGDTLTYTLTTTVADAATTAPLVLTDTLGAGLSFGAVTDTGAYVCSGALQCTLPAGTVPGTYAVTYTATVDADATGTVGNSVTASGGGGDPPVCDPCTTGHDVEPTAIAVTKTADPTDGSEVVPGQTLTYTLTATVATSATTDVLVLTDTLGAGLTFGAVTNAGAFACTGTLQCTLPAGTLPGSYAVTYTATVDADATGSVGNSVTASGGGGDPPVCDPCTTGHEVQPPTIGVAKTADPASGSEVRPGDTLTYTLTATVEVSATTEPLVLTDTLGAGLSFGAVTNAGAFSCTGTLQCTLPAGTLPGSYAVTYTATVDADATGTVGNSVTATGGGDGDPPVCDPCTTEHEVEPATISVAKTADPASGSEVLPGDTLTYTLTATVEVSATTEPLVLTDTLDAGLSFGAVTNAGAFACTGTLQCTLPAGTLPGSYALTYTATVDADATGTIGNSVTATGGGDGDPPVCDPCTTEHEVRPPTIGVAKTADPGAGSEVLPGDTLTYTLTATVEVSATTEPLVLTDTLGAGLSFGAVTDTGAFACNGELVCTLPAGTLPGTYAVTYTATVDADATGTVGNSVTASGGGGDPPVCDPCTTGHEVELPLITTVKSSDPPSGAEIHAGDVITYTLTVTVENSATTEALRLDDTLGDGHTLLPDSIQAPAGGSCVAQASGLQCTLDAGTLPGTYVFVYRTQVDPDATGEIGNTVVPSGGGNQPLCGNCGTSHPLAEPLVSVAKTSAPGDGTEVGVGDTIDYTLTVTIENAAITTPVRLTDTPGAGLTVGELPAGCSGGSGGIVCTVAAGTVPGTYTFSYPATVNADAVGEVNNAVVSEYGGSNDPVCEPCGTSHPVRDEALLRIVKSVGVRSARIGDIVRYTLTVENIGVVNLVDGTVVDTPPAGFGYVEGSMAVDDGDDAFTLSPGRHPLRIGGLDIAVGEQATIVYMLRIGAGVRHGTHVNEAVAQDPDGEPISNVATAQVTIDADPLLDDSLIFGTVFDDRDGDGWQDNAELTGVRVQGGFAPDAYLAGSTTLERGADSAPVADASAPLLHGIAIGSIAARQSEADPVEARQVVVRQRLSGEAFTDDFVLTSDQGVTLRLDADGRSTLERDGEAAKGLNGALPTVERRIAQGEGGLVVDYVIGNAGIDERGVPGVRIASVDGVLIETDQYGRYHLVDVPGGERGYRNFILKVDPATLPPGTAFTTDNPRVRRITPGVPVRFDFGVRLPVAIVPAGADTVEMALGEVVFAPGSAEVRAEYLPAIARMAGQVDAHRGGEVVITADGDSQALAFDRATAVREALIAQVAPEHASALTVNVRTEVDALVAGVTEGGALLGTLLFDTDRSAIRPEFAPLLDRIAARLEAMDGGTIAVVGHTDVRGSHAYNTALGLRRARAVYEALAERLSPGLRARVRVESSNDPTAPVGPERK